MGDHSPDGSVSPVYSTMETIMNAPTTIDIETEAEPAEANIIPLTQFVTDFGDSLVDAVNQQNPPVFQP